MSKNFSALCKKVQTALDDFAKREELYNSKIELIITGGDGISGLPIRFSVILSEKPKDSKCRECGKCGIQ